MGKLLTWSKINLLLTGIVLVIAFVLPELKKGRDESRMSTVESTINDIIQKKQIENFASQRKYIAIAKKSQSDLKTKIGGIQDSSMMYYTYTITTTAENFTVIAEPKIDSLKNQEIPAKFYTYTYQDKNGGKWSSL